MIKKSLSNFEIKKKGEINILISIIIVNFNGEKFIKSCLTSIFKSNYKNYEILIVDCASSDSSKAILLKNYVHIKNCSIIFLKSDPGYDEANNIAAKKANGNYLYFLNNDTVVDRYFLENIIKVISTQKRIGILQSKVLQINKIKIDSAGDFINRWGGSFCRGKDEVDNGQYDNKREIFCAGACAMIISKKLFIKVGMFDSDFFFYLEDVDLSWRLRLMNYDIQFCPQSLVYHHRGGTVNYHSKLVVYHTQKNRILVLLKNYSILNIIKYMPIRILIQINDIIFFVRKGNFTNVKATLFAWYWIINNIAYIFKKRNYIQKNLRVINDNQVISKMSGLQVNPFKYLFKASF